MITVEIRVAGMITVSVIAVQIDTLTLHYYLTFYLNFLNYVNLGFSDNIL